MDNQKAIEILIEDLDTLVDIAWESTTMGEWRGLENSAAQIRVMLEKGIAIKPIEHTTLSNNRTTWLCPTCNRLYWDKEFLSDYCTSCGQKFDLKLEG